MAMGFFSIPPQALFFLFPLCFFLWPPTIRSLRFISIQLTQWLVSSVDLPDGNQTCSLLMTTSSSSCYYLCLSLSLSIHVDRSVQGSFFCLTLFSMTIGLSSLVFFFVVVVSSISFVTLMTSVSKEPTGYHYHCL